MRKRLRLPGVEALLDRARRRRVLPALAAIGAVALAIGIVIGGGAPASSKGASAARTSGSTTVQRRDLIATDTQAGTLGYADPRTVFNRVSGTITWLPSVGSHVKPGGTLYKVDGAPVVLFDGTVPAYRTLTAGVADGPDVAELKQNLISLGFDPSHTITVNNTFDAATTAAIDSWQASLGETQTGQITLGQVVFLPGARRISAVSGVLGSTGGSGAAGSSGGASSSSSGTTTGASATTGPASSAAPASFSPAPAQAQFVSLTTAATTTPAPVASAGAVTKSGSAAACPTQPTATTTAPVRTPTAPTSTCPPPTGKTPSRAQRMPTATQLLAELVAALKKLAASSNAAARGGASGATSSRSSAAGGASAGASGSASGGGAGGASGAGGATGSSSASGGGTATQILQTTSADLVVTVQLDATKQSEAVIGAPVTVQLPDGSTDNGKITGVSAVAQSSSSSSSGTGGAAGGAASGTPTATVPVTITLTGHRHVVGLDQAAVSVNFQQQVERGVLSVPVTALLATAGGGYAVQTVGAGQPRLIPVTPGLFAGGYVQVSGPDVVEGMQVSDSQG